MAKYIVKPTGWRIYYLAATDDQSPRYVGMTGLPLESRLAQHIYEHRRTADCSRPKNKWITETLGSGAVISIHLLETCESEKEAKLRELHWISKMAIDGDILNVAGRFPSGIDKESAGDMRWKLRSLMERYAEKKKRNITYAEISAVTGIGCSTLSCMATQKATRVDIDTLEKILTFFQSQVEDKLSMDDLLERNHDRT